MWEGVLWRLGGVGVYHTHCLLHPKVERKYIPPRTHSECFILSMQKMLVYTRPICAFLLACCMHVLICSTYVQPATAAHMQHATAAIDFIGDPHTCIHSHMHFFTRAHPHTQHTFTLSPKHLLPLHTHTHHTHHTPHSAPVE